jgi:hypothetical protein
MRSHNSADHGGILIRICGLPDKRYRRDWQSQEPIANATFCTLQAATLVVHPAQIFACKLSDVDLTLQNLKASDGPFLTEITVNPATGTANMRTVCGWALGEFALSLL